eukprot:6356964-Prymnesium_polylepis.1
MEGEANGPRLPITRSFGVAIHLIFRGDRAQQVAAALSGSSGLRCLIEGEVPGEEVATQWRLLSGPAQAPAGSISLTLTSPKLQAQQGLNQLVQMLTAAREARSEPTGGINVWINTADMDLEQMKKVCAAFITYEPGFDLLVPRS